MLYIEFGHNTAFRTQLVRRPRYVYLKPDFCSEKFGIRPVAPSVTREKQPRRSKQDPNNSHQ